MQNGTDQITRFLSRIPAEENRDIDPNAPLVVTGSALELTREQEDDLVAHAMQRYENLSSELGRDQTLSGPGGGLWFMDGGESGKTAAATFLGKRQLYEMVYHNRVEWRAHLVGGIYEEHNLCIPAARRVIQQQIARADNFFFGSEPWLSVSPIGSDDKQFANSIDRWVKDRFHKAGTIQAHKQANEGAFIRGEDVIKTTYRKWVDYHETIASILVGPDGAPILAKDGDYIFEEDVWILNPAGGIMLRRDMMTVPPKSVLIDDPAAPGHQIVDPQFFQTKKVPRTLTKYQGSESKVVYFMDFLCPLDAENVQTADCCIHLYDQPAIDIAAMLVERMGDKPEPGKLPRLLEILNNMGAGSGERMERGAMGRPEEGEGANTNTETGGDKINPMVHLGEFYLSYDPFGDGRGRREIVLLLDLNSREPIYYDYLANVTPDGMRPFHVPRINPVNNRWHGTGNMETYWPLQEMIDLLANRWNMSQSASARVDFWNPSAVVEGDADPNLELNGGETYTLKPNRKAEDALQVVYLTDIKSDRIHDQIQYLQQHLTNMSGVANANDSRSAGLDTAELATGVNNIQASGEELFSPWVSHLTPGHESAARAAIMIEIRHMNPTSIFHFFEGKERRLGTISRSELRDLELDIKIEMTRFRTERELIQNEKAYTVFHRFYSLPRVLQTLWVDQAKRNLSNLEVVDAEKLIVLDYFSFPEDMGLPTDPPSEGVTAGLGSQKPGIF